MNDAHRQSPEVAHKVSDIGRYRLIAELARGGMGIVFLALVRGPGGFNKLFCVKVLRGQMAEDQKLVSMFLEEARLAAKLNHPNVVQTIEVGSDAGQHFIAMEYLEGQSLHSIQARARRMDMPFPLGYQLHVLVQLLEGLQYAHSATDFDGTPLRLVHRDVSPHNLFVQYEGQVKVLDFGIAKALDSSNDTNSGVLKGKIAYMAPEQAAGEPLDGRADIFSAGVMLWEAATGQRMWSRALNDLQILHALMKGTIPDPRAVAPDLDPRLEGIIRRATAVQIDERYPTAAEMQRDLEAHLRAMDTPSFGARDIGKLVSEAFAEDRARIRAVIEAQLGRLHGATSGQYATIDMPLLQESSGSGGGTPSGILRTNEPERPTVIEGLRSSSGMRNPMTRTGVSRQKRSRVPLVAAAVAGVAVVGAVGFTLLRRPAADPASPPLPTAAPSSAPAAATVPSAAAQPSAVASETPPDVAGAPSPSASAEGSTGRTHPVPFVHWRAHSTPAVGPTAVPTTTAPPSTPQPSSTQHVRQQIDTSNPYGH